MPTLGTGTKTGDRPLFPSAGTRTVPAVGKRGLSPGFTLIEILVVVAIAGILIALVAVNLFPDQAQAARREAGNVALAIEHARDAAWFGGRPTAVTFTDGRVREWRFLGREWQADNTRDQSLGADVRVTGLYLDGTPLKLDDRLVFMPDGFGIPFRVALAVRGFDWGVEGDVAGAVTLVER
jgi:general secretion pathway protein H